MVPRRSTVSTTIWSICWSEPIPTTLIVHELASSIAADVNNEGLDGQLRHLIDQMGVQGATKQLERLAEEHSASTDNDLED